MFKKIFKRKEVTDSQTQFSLEDLSEWPSQPGEGNFVPSLDQIISNGGPAGKAAKVLKEVCEKAKNSTDNVEYQAVMQSQYGLFVIPGIIQIDNSKKFVAYYSNKGGWDEEAIGRLLQWTVYLRACDFVHNLKVELCDVDAPKKAKEIVSSKKAHRMMINLIPNTHKGKPKVNARVFSECYAFHCNDKKLLSTDLRSLDMVENWYNKEVRSTARDSFFFPHFVRFIGSFFGQVLCSEFKGEWLEGEWPGVTLNVNDSKMRIDVFKLASDYVCSPHVKTSLVGNFHLIKDSINRL